MTTEEPGTRGTVVSLNISTGGVPKMPVRGVTIEKTSITGDGQNDRKHHGGPERAICIFSHELIEMLRAEGHPISSGSAGENVTVSGLDWSRVVPGVRLRIGRAEVEVTSYTSPCRTIRNSFSDGDFMRISQIKNPGWSRVYARVLVPAAVTAGESVSFVTGALAHSLP